MLFFQLCSSAASDMPAGAACLRLFCLQNPVRVLIFPVIYDIFDIQFIIRQVHMKKIIAFLLIFSLLLCIASCSDGAATESGSTTEETEEITVTDEITTEAEATEAPATDTETNNEETVSMQLIPDTGFKNGIDLITQKDHKNNDRFTVFKTHSFYGENSPGGAVWRLAQWDSGTDLSLCLTDSDDGSITDGKYRKFAYDPDQDMMTFHLDTSLYYNGSPAVRGDYWPHLLIEQADFSYKELDKSTREFYRCKSKNMILSMDIKLGEYKETPVDGDWVRAAQFLLYFYVKGINSNDFCWFGIQLFDNRWEKNDHYIGYDGGKADASGAMIYSVGSKYVYTDGSLWKDGKPQPDGDWVHIEIDLKPYIDDMLRRGLDDGYFKVKSVDKLCINGMNMGWETIGTFDHTMYVKNLSLVSYPDGM